MRKQYHLRSSDQGVLAWDVHRLVDLTKSLHSINIPLSEIRELDEAFWFGEEGDKPTCRRIALHAQLIEETDLEHPIILSEEGRVMDGMHRVCKALILGKETVKAVRFKTTPEPDYIGVEPEKLPY